MRYLYVIPLLALILIACENPTGGSSKKEEEEMAQVIIKLPSQEENPRAVELEDAKAATDFYEVVFRGGEEGSYTYFRADAGSAETDITLSIPVDTYDILLLAGRNIGIDILLASDYLEDESIVAGSNVINLLLETVDIEILCDSDVVITTPFSFNLQVTCDTKNPFIQPTIQSLRITHNFSGVDSGSIVSASISNTGNLYTITFPVITTAPANTGDKIVTIDCPYSFRAFGQTVHTGWYFAYSNDSALGSYYQKTVNFTAASGSSNVAVNIDWLE